MHTAALPVLPLARYRLKFRATEPVRLPSYSGSAWRGAFGRALKRLACVTREPACPDCLLYRSCVYPYVFETPPGPAADKLRKGTAAPHPFVLSPGPENRGLVPENVTLSLELTLFGHGNRFLPYVVHALNLAGQAGLGRGHGRLAMQTVEQASDGEWHSIFAPGTVLSPLPMAAPAPPPCPERFDLVFETPLRLKADGHYVTPETFGFGPLFSNLLRRISLLSTFHTDAPLDTDFAGLTRAARRVDIDETHLRWQEWTRYSGRQNTLMQMGGLRGRVRLSRCDALEAFWPYLWLGQWTHAGKGTSMGLGRYQIRNRSE